MGYSIEFKKSIIEDFKLGIDNIEGYVKAKGISKTTFYKWTKEERLTNVDFIDITNITTANTKLQLNINNVEITIDDNYNESLLLKVIRSLNKL